MLTNNSMSSFYKRPVSTKYENLLASALDKIAFTIPYLRNREVWLSACVWYTPDFIIGNRLIVEVDGGIHELDYRKTPDRIRQRALENLGYHVFRVKNQEVSNSLKQIVEKIIELYYSIAEQEQRPSRIRKVKKPRYESLPENLQKLITPWVIKFNSQLNGDENHWAADYFKESLTQFDKRLVADECAMERFMLQLLGLNLRRKENYDNLIDFEYFSALFRKAIKIMSDMFESDMSGVYLVNSFNITAPNFLKNLVFEGGPKVNPAIVSVKDGSTLETSIANFNQSFSKLDITVDKSDVVFECIKELEKRKKLAKVGDKGDKENLVNYQWLAEWAKVTRMLIK